MIKQPSYAVLSLILFAVVVGYAIERITFLKRAERATGKVVEMSSSNGRCGGRSKHNCTRYSALVHFLARDTNSTLIISAGSSRGHDRPLEYADVHLNDQVPVVYDPLNPTKAYEDTTAGVWGTPILILIFQISSLFASLSEPKSRREE